MSYVRSKRGRQPLSGYGTAVYQAVMAASDKVRGLSVTPIHPGMSVTPIHPGMSVTPLTGLGAIPMMARQRRRPQTVRRHHHSLGATAIEYTPTIILQPPPPPPKVRRVSSRGWSELGAVQLVDIGACQTQAEQQTASIDAMANELSANWHPTGSYTSGDMRNIMSAILAMTSPVWDDVLAAQLQTNSTQQDVLKQALDDLSAVGSQANDYLAAANAADAAGVDTAIDAPLLKHWVVHALDVASSAEQAAYVARCIIPGVTATISAFFVAVGTTVYGVASGVAGVVKKAGEAAVHAAEKIFDVTTFLIAWGPWVGVGVGALWLYKTYGTKSKRSSK